MNSWQHVLEIKVAINGSQLAKMNKYIPYMSLQYNW